MNNSNYVINSLELHLFFGRIMKEHSFFLRAGFTPANPSFSEKAEFYMKEFEKLLSDAIALSNGLVRDEVLRSGEIVTEFTALAENQSERFTGIPINRELTARERRLVSGDRCPRITAGTVARISRLNRAALRLLNGLIAFKEIVLRNVLSCRMFTVNYPLLIEHIIREARLYREFLLTLEKDGNLSRQSMRDVESFWNRIMMEHAMFIRGLLDPTEAELINSADGFAKDYAALLESSRNAQDRAMSSAAYKHCEISKRQARRA